MTRPDGPDVVGTREELVADLVDYFLSSDNQDNDDLVDELTRVMRHRANR